MADLAEVDQAEARLRDAKAAAQADRNEATMAELKAARQAVSDIRLAYRTQEIEAGRRGAGVGVGPNDAAPSPPTIATGP